MLGRVWQCVVVLGAVVAMTVAGHELTVCQNEDMSIDCGPGLVIVPQKVFYGRRDSAICRQPGESTSTCSHHDAMGPIVYICFMKQKCELKHENAHIYFEDPCEGVSKYLQMEYQCVAPSSVHSICDGGVITDQSGFVVSPQYPQDYLNDQHCRVSIVAGRGQRIRFTIHEAYMQYEQATDRCYDFLTFMQWYHSFANKVCDLDQQVSNKPFKEFDLYFDNMGTYVNISFESGSSTTYRGFLFEFKVMGCSRDDLPKPPSDGYVLHYDIAQVTYGCKNGFAQNPSSLQPLACVGTKWVGEPGECLNDATTTSSTSSTLPITSPTSVPSSTTSSSTSTSSITSISTTSSSPSSTAPSTSSSAPSTSTLSPSSSTATLSTAPSTTTSTSPPSTSTSSSPPSTTTSTSPPSTSTSSSPPSTTTSSSPPSTTTSSSPPSTSTSSSPPSTSTSSSLPSTTTSSSPPSTSTSSSPPSTTTSSSPPSTTTLSSPPSTSTSSSPPSTTTSTSPPSISTSSSPPSTTTSSSPPSTTTSSSPPSTTTSSSPPSTTTSSSPPSTSTSSFLPSTTTSSSPPSTTNSSFLPSTTTSSASPSTTNSSFLPSTTTSSASPTSSSKSSSESIISTEKSTSIPPITTSGVTKVSTPGVSTTLSEQTTQQMAVASASLGLGVQLGIGVVSGLIILVLIISIVIVSRKTIKRRQKIREANEGLASLRPSKHACVSIPNSYAGVGFASTKAGSMRTVGDMVPQAPRPTRRAGGGNDQEVRTSDISFESAIYEMPVGSGNRINTMGTHYPRDPYHEDMYSSGSGLIENEIYPSPLEPIAEETPTEGTPEEDGISVATDSTFTSTTGSDVDETSPRPTSLEDTKNERSKRRPPKVNYPLFKSDETGNLSNYLEDRRVSV